MDLKKVCVCGHFGFGENLLNGQTVKTKIIASAIKKTVGGSQMLRLDTAGGARSYWLLPFRLLSVLRRCKNVVILPGSNGLRMIAPLLASFNHLFHRSLHYVVIGGWLADYLKGKGGKSKVMAALKRFTGIYVETESMRNSLAELGFTNVYVMPNCKELKMLNETDLVYETAEPYRLCTFSRVMKEKGIGEAIAAVKTVNETLGRTAFTLDIYGQVEQEQRRWFHRRQKAFPDYVVYGGVVPFQKSVEVIKDYFAVLFPTYYEGEGFAGTIIDSFAAGVPIIASDWKYNREIVKDGVEGAILPPQDADALAQKLFDLLQDPQGWNAMKAACLRRAADYTPAKAITVLTERLL